MAFLGRIYYAPGTQSSSRFGVGYDDLLTIPAAQMLSGTGAGKDYVLVCMAQVGPMFNNGQSTIGRSFDMTTRFGLRFRAGGEIGQWSQFHHPTCGIRSRGIPGSELGHPVVCVGNVRDMPLDDILVSMQSFGPEGPGVAYVQDLLVLVLDCTLLGGARNGAGWLGTRLVVEPLQVGATPGPTSVTLPGAVDDAWLVLAARRVQTTGRYSMTVHNTGIGYNARSGRAEPISLGTWTVQRVESPAVATVVAVPAGTGSAGDGGLLVCLKLTGLDNGAATAFTADDDNGVANNRNNVAVTREYGLSTTRTTDSMVQMIRCTLPNGAGAERPVGVVTHARQNGWNFSSTRDFERAATWQQINDELPSHACTVTPPGHEVPEGGAVLDVDRYAPPGLAGSRALNSVRHVVGCQFSLSDFGPIVQDPPPTFTTLVLNPAYEADMAALPMIAAPMRAVSPFDGQTQSSRMLTAGQYEIRHGGGNRERLVVPVVGESLTMDDVDALVTQANTATAFRHTLDDGTERAWRWVPGSLTWSESTDGLVSVSGTMIEHIYLAPPP